MSLKSLARIRPWEKWTLSAMGVIAISGAALAARCWAEAHDDPKVVTYEVAVHGLDPGTRFRIAFLSDTHVHEDRTASSVNLARLRDVVWQTNALKPDAVILGGDYVSSRGDSGDVAFGEAVAPFSALRARYGVFSVVGNHDCERPGDTPERMVHDLKAAGTTPLINAFADAGPVVIAGLDEFWCGSSDPATSTRAVAAAGGRPVVLATHNPDAFPDVPSSIAVTLAGHTHAGQIVPPVIGPIVSSSRYGARFRHGRIVEGGRTLIVSAGIGGPPFRWNAHPEIVIVELVPA